jgi:hypothetical protein
MLNNILYASLLISCVLAGYITFQHIIAKRHQTCYDSWLFPVLLAMVLQVTENRKN